MTAETGRERGAVPGQRRTAGAAAETEAEMIQVKAGLAVETGTEAAQTGGKRGSLRGGAGAGRAEKNERKEGEAEVGAEAGTGREKRRAPIEKFSKFYKIL